MNLLGSVAKAGRKVFKPVVKAVAKVSSKLDANKPEIMVVGGVTAVVVGTVWAIAETMKVQKVMDNSKEEMIKAEAQRDGLVLDKDGNPVPPVTEAEFRKLVTKVRSETVWAFIKMYGIPALMFVLGIFTLVKGHWILKQRYILTATSLKGMEEFVRFVKKNVIEDAGEEKWKEYATGKVGEKEVSMTVTDKDGNVTTKKTVIPVCKERSFDNPWRIQYCEELFDSWTTDSQSNLFFLQGAEKYWNEEKYQNDKTAEISMFEILKYLGFKFEKVDKKMRDFFRNNGWAHDINGDGFISFGLKMAVNDAARQRKSDVLFIEFNSEGILRDLHNQYYYTE